MLVPGRGRLPQQLVELRLPAIFAHIDAAGNYRDIFFLEQLLLLLEPGAAGLERDFTRRGDDPMPG